MPCAHSASTDPGLPLVFALLTVARFLTCLMMWEILRAFIDASLSSGVVIPDASIVLWELRRGEARSPRSGPLRCSLVARVCPWSRCARAAVCPARGARGVGEVGGSRPRAASSSRYGFNGRVPPPRSRRSPRS